jgi:vancomycin resistance protein YoaR
LGERSVTTTARDLGGRCDTDGAVAAALAAGRSEGLLDRLRDRVGLGGADPEIALTVAFDARELGRRLQRKVRRFERPPVEPRARIEDGQLVATSGRPGRVLDEAAGAAAVQKSLADAEWCRQVAASAASGTSPSGWAANAAPRIAKLVLREAAPRVTPDDVRHTQTPLSTFTTSFSLRDRNRAHNIRVAARAIHGLFLMPGDEFSYNATVGRRRASAGYRTAPEIVQGNLVPGIGGGVCQVSSTLYNAALLADLEITRRHHHRFPVHYLPAGRDATVSDSGLDLRFRNRLGAPIALLVAVNGGRVHARIFGTEHSRRTVRLLTQKLRPAFTRKGGRRVALLRVVENDGAVIRRETISRDSYEPPPASYHSGRGEPPRRRRSTRRRVRSVRPPGNAIRAGTIEAPGVAPTGRSEGGEKPPVTEGAAPGP